MEVCKYLEICAVTKCVVPTGKIFWNCLGIIHHELLESYLTITADICIQQQQRMNEKLHEKHPALVNCQNVILLDNNTRQHTESVHKKVYSRTYSRNSSPTSMVSFTTYTFFSGSGTDILSTFLFLTEFSEWKNFQI